MTVEAQKETLGFQTEVKQVLDLVIHSLYSNKEIFLRELISNASDAADKLRFLALSNNTIYGNDSNLKIRIDYDDKKKTLTVSDNGIGMTRQEVIDHLGTIAKSGTKEFLTKLTGEQAKDSNLIGQFGVGFYSAFIVADKVTVETRSAHAGADHGVRWISEGKGDYTIETIPKSQRGTEVTLHLKDSEVELLNDWRLKSIITKYSDHISWPIEMKEPPKEGEKEKTPPAYQTINRATALWTLNKSEIKDEQYNELYKHISHDFEAPLLWSHNHVEGKQQYISLLYIPSRAPFDIWQPEFQRGLKLFVKRVFILDKADQFLPRYLRFVKGIVDSNDLPLNVSREVLQDNPMVETIRKSLVKRVLGLLEKTANTDKEKYATFWKEFGLVLKEGPIEDFANRQEIAGLLRFSSTHTDSPVQDVSFADYVSRMQKGQDKIYFMTAESFNAAKNSPHLEIFRKKGIEVLLLSDRIDEWLVSHLSDFDGKHLQSVTKGKLDLGEIEDKEEKELIKKDEETHASFIKHIQEVLKDSIKEARITHRLTTSPACVVSDAYDMGREMQRILQAAGQEAPKSQPIFEINPHHPLVERLKAETDDERFSEWVHILFDQAVLAEGGRLEDSAQFVQRLNRMLLELSK